MEGESSLEQLLTRSLAESLNISYGEANERFSQPSCMWPSDFRAKVAAAIRRAGNDPTNVLSEPHN